MARYFVYCFIFNLACCFALPQIGDRLGKQVNYSIVILGHCHPSRMSRLCVHEHNESTCQMRYVII